MSFRGQFTVTIELGGYLRSCAAGRLRQMTNAMFHRWSMRRRNPGYSIAVLIVFLAFLGAGFEQASAAAGISDGAAERLQRRQAAREGRLNLPLPGTPDTANAAVAASSVRCQPGCEDVDPHFQGGVRARGLAREGWNLHPLRDLSGLLLVRNARGPKLGKVTGKRRKVFTRSRPTNCTPATDGGGHSTLGFPMSSTA